MGGSYIPKWRMWDYRRQGTMSPETRTQSHSTWQPGPLWTCVSQQRDARGQKFQSVVGEGGPGLGWDADGGSGGRTGGEGGEDEWGRDGDG